LNLIAIAISSNQSLLIDLVDNLSLIAKNQLAIFTKPEMIAGNVSVGKQVRHILDFYTVLFEGLENNVIDYDKRERDPGINFGKAPSTIAYNEQLVLNQ